MESLVRRFVAAFFVFCLGALASGCANLKVDNQAQLQSYSTPIVEAGWIRNGEPIIFEGHEWYPVADTENLMDFEVYQIGEYKDVQIFVDKVDIKPYHRLFTKFAKGKFRYFERRD
jgi:hypothetical protein